MVAPASGRQSRSVPRDSSRRPFHSLVRESLTFRVTPPASLSIDNRPFACMACAQRNRGQNIDSGKGERTLYYLNVRWWAHKGSNLGALIKSQAFFGTLAISRASNRLDFFCEQSGSVAARSP
jgi:hypothetical protein